MSVLAISEQSIVHLGKTRRSSARVLMPVQNADKTFASSSRKFRPKDFLTDSSWAQTMRRIAPLAVP